MTTTLPNLAHDRDPHAFAYGTPRWRRRHDQTYCSYCGSWAADELLEGLEAGVIRLEGSDWKYGWPHKFYVRYVEARPNPLAIEPEAAVYPTDGAGVAGPLPPGKRYWVPAETTTAGKFYTSHVLDLFEAAPQSQIDRFVRAFHAATGVGLSAEEGRVKWTTS